MKSKSTSIGAQVSPKSAIPGSASFGHDKKNKQSDTLATISGNIHQVTNSDTSGVNQDVEKMTREGKNTGTHVNIHAPAVSLGNVGELWNQAKANAGIVVDRVLGIPVETFAPPQIVRKEEPEDTSITDAEADAIMDDLEVQGKKQEAERKAQERRAAEKAATEKKEAAESIFAAPIKTETDWTVSILDTESRGRPQERILVQETNTQEKKVSPTKTKETLLENLIGSANALKDVAFSSREKIANGDTSEATQAMANATRTIYAIVRTGQIVGDVVENSVGAVGALVGSAITSREKIANGDTSEATQAMANATKTTYAVVKTAQVTGQAIDTITFGYAGKAANAVMEVISSAPENADTQVRRAVRNGTGSQAVGQDLGLIAGAVVEFLGPKKVAQTLQLATKVLPATKLVVVSKNFEALGVEGVVASKAGKSHLAGLDLASSSWNKGIYNSHAMRELLESRYPGQVTSSTVPLPNQKNVKLAGQRHPETGIVYDQKGFPIFDDVAKFETRIGHDVSALKNGEAHMRAATSDLRANIITGKVNRELFTSQQLSNIMDNKSKIDGLTWHHHQDIGRMQLIPETLHKETGHIGGKDKWTFGKSSNK